MFTYRASSYGRLKRIKIGSDRSRTTSAALLLMGAVAVIGLSACDPLPTDATVELAVEPTPVGTDECQWHPSTGFQCDFPASHDVGWVWANQAASWSYEPHAAYQYNSDGATNRITRLGRGRYQVRFPGLAGPGGSAQVSAYGGSHVCQAESLSQSGDAMVVTVRCFSPNRTAQDGRFTALYLRRVAPHPLGGVYARVTGSSLLAAPWLWTSFGSTPTLSRSGSTYTLDLAPSRWVDERALVTPLGAAPASCRASGASPLTVDCTGAVTTGLLVTSVRPSDLFMLGEVTALERTDVLDILGCWVISTGDPRTWSQMCRDAPGRYRVVMHDVPVAGTDWPSTGSTALVTGTDAACGIDRWGGVSAGVEVQVRCRDRFGSPVDSGFRLLYLTDRPALS